MAIIVPIGVDTSGLTRGLSQGTSGLRKFGKMAALVGGAAALGGLVATLKIGVDEFMGAQKVLAQTGAVLKSTGGAANVTSKQITTMSNSLMKLSGIDDEAIQSGQNLLLTFRKIRNETGKGNNIFDQATLAMTNLSVAMGKDLTSSAILVGKALNDPVKGVGALSRAGVQFTASQKDTIKALVESGDVMSAQKMILKELETQFGGSAKAAGQTLPGQLNILKETFRNTAADLVARFMPAITAAAQKLLNFVREFSARPTFVGKVSFVVGRIKDFVGDSYDSLKDWWTKSKTMLTPGSPVPIVVKLSGREEVDKGYRELQAKAALSGGNAGKNFADSFFENGIGGNFLILFGKIFDGLKAFFRYSGAEAAATFIGGFVVEFTKVIYNRRGEIADAFKRAFYSIDFTEILKIVAKSAVTGPKIRKLFKPLFDIILVDPIRDAIASARASLSGLGSEIGGFLARIGAAGGKSKEAAAIRKRLKDEADAREEARLTEAVANAETDEDRRTAQRELDDFRANQMADRLDAEVQAEQDANQQKIDDLIQSFKDGAIGAEQFATDLKKIIGKDFGESLGIAFVAGFEGAIANLINEVQGIAAGEGGKQAPAGSTVAGAQSDVAIAARDAENAKRQAAYESKLAAWEKKRDARRDRAEEARRGENTPGGSKITAAEQREIDEIMREWAKKPENKKPVKPTMLAAGGILKRQVFTAGEAGREAVIPLGSTEAMGIMRDALGGSRGGATYNIVVNAGLGTNPDELSRVIVESIKRYEKRNGAVFQGPIVGTAANTSGKTTTDSGAANFNRIRSLRSG